MFDEDDLKSTRWRRLRLYKARIRLWYQKISRKQSNTTWLILSLILTVLILLLFLKPKVEVDLISQQGVNPGNKHTSSLFTEKKGPWYGQKKISGPLPNWVEGDPTVAVSHSHSLQLHMQPGLGTEQLQDLIQTKSRPEWETATVTTIINFIQQDSLQSQIEAVLAQAILPKAIWIVCGTDKQSVAETMVSKYSRQQHGIKIKTVVVESGKQIDQRIAYGSSWLQVAQLAPSDYIWVIDNNAAPGSGYLKYLLQLAHTHEYQSALLGTSGIILPGRSEGHDSQSGLLCIDNPPQSRSVDIINDVWLIRTQWIAQIYRQSKPEALAAPLGHYISQALNKYASIPSIVIPHEEGDHTLLADTLIAKRSLNSCQFIKEQLQHNTIWQDFLKYRTALSVVDYARATELASNPSQDGSVMFVVDGPDQARALRPLFCRFHVLGRTMPYVVVTGESRGMTAVQLRDTLEKHIGACANVDILDLDLDYGDSRGLPTGESAPLAGQVSHDLTRLMSALRPDLVIHVQQNANPVFQGVAVASKISNVMTITLPLDHVRHVLWMADLPMVALHHWHTISVNLIVITDRRPHSLSRLLRSASNAYFLGDKVSLSVNMEQTADKVTRILVANTPWPHGSKYVRHRIQKGGLMPAIVESWYPNSNDDYAIFLEDDVEVSPYFYMWVKYSILRYRYGNPSDRSDLLFGVSLYSPRNTEMGMQGRRLFNPDWVLNATSLDPRTPYLLQVPCSWGAVYFPEHWREFHEYVTARLIDLDTDARLNISVPESRSNRWKASWKRYFIEMIYLRGYTMLYPNFQNFTSFSTNHLEFGTHVKHERKAIEQFLVPLMETNTILHELPRHRLPAWDELPVLDLWAKLSSNDELLERAKLLHSAVSVCPRRPDDSNNFDPQDMLCPHPRPEPEEQEVLKPTPVVQGNATTIYVTVYVTESPTPEPDLPAAAIDVAIQVPLPGDQNYAKELDIDTVEKDEVEEVDPETSDLQEDLDNLEKLWLEQQKKNLQEGGNDQAQTTFIWQDDENEDNLEIIDPEVEEEWNPDEWQDGLDVHDEFEEEDVNDLSDDTVAEEDPQLQGWPSPMPYPNLER